MQQAASIRAYEILSRLGASPRGAELGVLGGSLSRRLLVRGDLHLTMVDTWGVYRPTFEASGDMLAHASAEQQAIFRGAARSCTEFAEDRRTIVEADTVKAAEGVPMASLDFVFVDADHSYEGCAADIEAWFPKIRPGGLLCGHDYAHSDFPLWGVKRAVDEFAAAHGFEVELGADYTWFIRLPGQLPIAASADTFDQVVFACVKWGDQYGSEYVNVLADMVARNCGLAARFVCFTDDPAGLDDGVETEPLPPGLTGWWNKLYLFAPDVFLPRTRIVFLDLDVIVTGPLEPLIATKGIASDWLQAGYNSSVMVWDAGEHGEAWERFTPDVAERLHGDQDWLNEATRWVALPADWIVSYRLHAMEWPPVGSVVVAFHGLPKPHEVRTGWVPEMWTMNGLAEPRYTSVLNNDIAAVRENIAINRERDLPAIEMQDAHERAVCIVGGGPSLDTTLMAIQSAKARGADVWALNGAHRWLDGKGIAADAVVLLDSRPENVEFLYPLMPITKYYLATQCHPSLFERLAGRYTAIKWTAWFWGVDDDVIIGGGATVGLKSIALAYTQGYRRFKLFGFDSSYRDTEHHAYPQPMNDAQATTDVVVRGRKFHAAKWMVKQTREFQELARSLMSMGCEIEVYGDGLLPYVCRVAVEAASKGVANVDDARVPAA